MVSRFLEDLKSRSFWIRVILFVLATALCEFGIAGYYNASLGTDPISVFVEGVTLHCELTVGQVSTICNAAFTLLIFIFMRDKIGVGTLITVLIGGPLIDLSFAFIDGLFPEKTMLIRILLLASSVVIYAAGLGLTLACDLGIGPFSFPPLMMNKVSGVDLKYTQIISDAAFFLTGVLLGGKIGIGTICGVGLTGPIMSIALNYASGKLEKM